MRGITLGMIVIWLALYTPAAAETIYTWTDKDGTKRFSNEHPPEGVTEYKTETVSSDDPRLRPSNQRRQSYDQMVERAKAESVELETRRKEAEAARQKELNRQAEAERQRSIDKQVKALEQQIAAVKNRGLSTTYSKGMRDAQIKKLQDQIDRLIGETNKKEAPAE